MAWYVVSPFHFNGKNLTQTTTHKQRQSTGTDRYKKFTPYALESADVVLTSYGTLANELEDKKRKGEHEVVRQLKKKKQWLLKTRWHRIILDEGHIIRNKRTKAHKACTMIKAKHRWFLSGTPIPNCVDDAFGLLAFLRTQPLNDGGIFHRVISRPIKKGRSVKEKRMALTRLRLLFKTISIRRKKSILAGKLPSKTIVVKKLVLDKTAREVYDLILSASRCVFERCIRALHSSAAFERCIRARSAR